MNSKTHSILSAVIATALVSSGAVADSHKEPARDWKTYGSAMNNMPIDRSFNDIDIRKKDVDITKTDNSTDDSYNTSTAIDADIDASKKAYGSFNRKKETNTTTSLDFDLDASDNSAHDSYNDTDNSINDSYNKHLNVDVRKKHFNDQMAVTPTLTSNKEQYTGDSQSAGNANQMYGHSQAGQQGAVDVGGIGNDGPSYGAGWGTMYGGGMDNRNSENNQKIRVDGPNLGAISNTSVVNQGRDLVFGPNRSAIGNDFGNKQIFSAGDQAQLQELNQVKQGDTSVSASDSQATDATKTSSNR